MTKAILGTGGAGFIGSAVVREPIRETGRALVNVDKLAYVGNLDSLAAIEENPRYHFAQVDICDAETLRSLFVSIRPTQ